MNRLFLSTIMILLVAGYAAASESDTVTIGELVKEVKALKAKVIELENKIARQEKLAVENDKIIERVDKLEHADTRILHKEDGGYEIGGLKIGAGATFVSQYAIDPNTAGDENHVLDGTYSIDLEIEKDIGTSGLAFIHLEAGEGNGLDGDEVTTFSTVNREANNTNMDVDVTEVWYEHNFLDNRLVTTAGKIDSTVYLDQNNIANDETSQFLSTIFRNSSAIDFPANLNTWGVRVGALPFDWLEAGVGVFDGDDDWEDLLEDYFVFSQLNIKPNLLEREGNYRVYAWYNDSNHTQWIDVTDTTDQNFGFGTSFDQSISDRLTIFTRFGWQDPDVSLIEWAWSTGLQFEGDPWGRENDYLGLAVGMDIPGDEYGDAGNADDPEGHVEAYYNFQVNDHIHISPDYQLVWNPNGEDDGPVNIISMRGQIDF